MSLLSVENVYSGYQNLAVVRDCSLRVEEGEIVALIGPNGAGKSTLLNTIFGLIRPMSGNITLDSTDLTELQPHEMSALGAALVPQVGSTFPSLSVRDNLSIATMPRRGRGAELTVPELLTIFPVLEAKLGQSARTLSGGERQMLALASGIAACSRFLALDEPTTGLAPVLVAQLAGQIETIRQRGVSILWVIEEDPLDLIPHCDRVYVLDAGEMRRELTSADDMARAIREVLFGATAAKSLASPEPPRAEKDADGSAYE